MRDVRRLRPPTLLIYQRDALGQQRPPSLRENLADDDDVERAVVFLRRVFRRLRRRDRREHDD